MDCKEFKDPVHGYILIEKDIVKKFIDKELFQRLRRIEQTSMRCLYPAARHDRFIHSLGVYHLGKITIESLFKNLDVEIESEIFGGYSKDEKETKIEEIKYLFSIACLMHDCAHSPFSHTYEKYYVDDSNINEYYDKINEGIELKENYITSKTVNPSPHELASCCVLIEKHKKDIEEGDMKEMHRKNLELIVRCILGAKYHQEDGNKLNQFYNAIISLLNSEGGIDVDKLDYILRDTYTSGVKNFLIDKDRFISSVTIVRNPYKSDKLALGYKKNALSVLSSIVYARDYLYRWIYSHHKVRYLDQMKNILLNKASENFNIEIKELSDGKLKSRLENTLKNFNEDKDKEYFKSNILKKAIFNIESFDIKEQVKIEKKGEFKFCAYMVDDSDINSLFKQLLRHTDEYEAVYNRQHHIPLWKSFAEYKLFFKGADYDDSKKLKIIVKEQIDKFCIDNKEKNVNLTNGKVKEKIYYKENYIIADVNIKSKLGYINPDKIFVQFKDKCHLLSTIYGSKLAESSGVEEEFFYLYVPRKLEEEKIKELKAGIQNNI